MQFIVFVLVNNINFVIKNSTRAADPTVINIKAFHTICLRLQFTVIWTNFHLIQQILVIEIKSRLVEMVEGEVHLLTVLKW